MWFDVIRLIRVRRLDSIKAFKAKTRYELCYRLGERFGCIGWWTGAVQQLPNLIEGVGQGWLLSTYELSRLLTTTVFPFSSCAHHTPIALTTMPLGKSGFWMK